MRLQHNPVNPIVCVHTAPLTLCHGVPYAKPSQPFAAQRAKDLMPYTSKINTPESNAPNFLL